MVLTLVGLLACATAEAAAGARLVVSSVSVSPIAGQRLRVVAVIRNAGARRSVRVRARYRVIGAGGATRTVAIRAVPALAPGRAARRSAAVGLPAGAYRVVVCAGARCRTVDAPSIGVGPPERTAAASARFTFSVRHAGPRFRCRLDSGAAVGCASPVAYASLAEGDHVFTVTAVRGRDAATTAWRWTIDAPVQADAVVRRPGATTGPVVSVQQTSATVSGSVTPAGSPTTYHFEYGSTLAYGSQSPAGSAGSGTAAVPVQATLTGLAAATAYHYRIVATTCGGCARGTSRGADRTFTTAAVATYQNPVYGGTADPMGLRGAGDYYVYGTGDRFPVLHSTDLAHWEPIGTAMTSRPAWVPQSGEWNPWAPSVLQRDGACPGTASASCFFMYYTGLNASLSPAANCIGVATSTSPAGPFADAGILNPATPPPGRPLGCGDAAGYSNIDPAPFVDPATGRGYLYLSTGHDASGAWQRTISVIPLADDLVHAAGPRQPLFGVTQPWEGDVVEGPWMVRHDDGYYLLYSGGSFTDATYAMGYALASSPTGPFAKPAAEPILKSTADVIGPGGGSALTGPDGADWLVYHGRAAVGAPRTLRIDPLVWNDAAVPPTVTVRGPTTSPQPLPSAGT